MTIERAIKQGKIEFEIHIKTLEFMLSVGAIALKHQPIEVRITYKMNVIFDCMKKLSHGDFHPNLEFFDSLPLYEQELILDNTANTLIQQKK